MDDTLKSLLEEITKGPIYRGVDKFKGPHKG